MPTKRKIKIELNSKEEALAHYEMKCGRNDSIRRQAKILYYANQEAETIKELCEKTEHDAKTMDGILKLYETMGNPPSDVPDAVRKIKKQFNIEITVTPVRKWLKTKAIRTKSQKAYR